MKLNIYVSSLAFVGQSAENIINICEQNNFSLEFSSGMPFREDMESLYKNTALKRMPHNYFPAPKVPFVLNLASSDVEIRNISIDHCKKGLLLAKKSNSPFFSAHAGFCIDPNPNELGKKISINNNFDKEVNKQFFLDSVVEVLKYSNELGIDFLIENNVIAPFNYDGENPLLCCEFNDINWLFESVKDSNLGLLLDTAHLKVSCKTLQLDLDDEFNKIRPFIKAFHHSDNDGYEDVNLPLSTNYWFLKYLKKYTGLPHVLEIKANDVNEINQQINLLEKNGY